MSGFEAVVVLNVLSVGLSLVSVALSAAALFKTEELDQQGHELSGTLGADMGNHEFRLDQVEDKLGIEHVHSPSAQEALDDLETSLHSFDVGVAANDEVSEAELSVLRAKALADEDEGDTHSVTAANVGGL